MAGVDQLAQIFVGLRIALPVMPRGDVQRADAGGAPARGEIIEIDARAIGGIEERPQALRSGTALRAPDRRAPAACRESAHSRAGRAARRPTAPRLRAFRSRPSAAASASAPREDARFLRNFEDRQIERLFPDDVQLRGAQILDAADGHVRFCGGVKSEGCGERRLAFEDQDRAALHSRPAIPSNGIESPCGATTTHASRRRVFSSGRSRRGSPARSRDRRR